MDWTKIVVLNFFLGEKRALNHHAFVGVKAVGQRDFYASVFVQFFYRASAGLGRIVFGAASEQEGGRERNRPSNFFCVKKL